MSDFIAIIFSKSRKYITGAKLSCGAGTIEALDLALMFSINNEIPTADGFSKYPHILWASQDKNFIENIQEISKANLYIKVCGKKQRFEFFVKNLFWNIEKDEEEDCKIGKLKTNSFIINKFITLPDLYRLIADLKDLEAQGYNAFRVGRQVWGLM